MAAEGTTLRTVASSGESATWRCGVASSKSETDSAAAWARSASSTPRSSSRRKTVEPTSVAEKAIGQAWEIQRRLRVWRPKKAAVLGTGTLGLLASMILKLRGDWMKTHGGPKALKAFHDQFLSYGGPPLPMVRKLMLGADAGPAL